MVDREGRDKLAFALRQFMSGRISEHKWEESLPYGTKDNALNDIANHLEFWFNNIYAPDYTLNGLGDFSVEDRKGLVRCLSFLYSDLEYSKPEEDTGILYKMISTVKTILYVIFYIPIFLLSINEFYSHHIFKKVKANPLWPFRQQSDLDDVLSKPGPLNGKRYSSY